MGGSPRTRLPPTLPPGGKPGAEAVRLCALFASPISHERAKYLAKEKEDACSHPGPPADLRDRTRRAVGAALHHSPGRHAAAPQRRLRPGLMAMSSTPAANAAARNPVASFYGGQRAVRWLGAVLRAAHRLAPPLGRRLTMRLFFTPFPTKQAARRRPLAAGWRIQALPFEQGTLALWQRERPGSGARVLLVHGWAGDAAQMLPLAESLAAAGFEPVLLDFPG